jgi:hypothetical protein
MLPRRHQPLVIRHVNELIFCNIHLPLLIMTSWASINLIAVQMRQYRHSHPLSRLGDDSEMGSGKPRARMQAGQTTISTSHPSITLALALDSCNMP